MSANDSSEPLSSLALSRLRHDLRTPINQIIGYCEMLQEDDATPASFGADLTRIHAGGRRLLELIGEHFGEGAAVRLLDLHQLCHELRTPVNHIIGYAELLEDEAADLGQATLLPDLKKITQAARTWLARMEEHLLPAAPGTVGPAGGLAPAETANTARAESSSGQRAPLRAKPLSGRLLVVDDDEANREMLARRLRRQGCEVWTAASGEEGLRLLHGGGLDLVLLDMLMPGLDGYEVLRRIKESPALQELPVIMISALDQEENIARCIEIGADDYIAKPFNPTFLRARISAGLDRKQLRDQERRTHEALVASQRCLAAELAEAAQYVRSLLPAPLSLPWQASWAYQPSAQLGGDAFGYEWLDERHFVVYLLDVCGHGVGAALLSVSVMNVLRTRTLPGVDFLQPDAVLAALNQTFPMERQNNMFFTIWYGVFDAREQRLRYASGGHPPALWLPPSPAASREASFLTTNGAAIGCFPEARYASAVIPAPPGSSLIIFSDGLYEATTPSGALWGLEAYRDYVIGAGPADATSPAAHVRRVELLQEGRPLEDDVSVVCVELVAPRPSAGACGSRADVSAASSSA